MNKALKCAWFNLVATLVLASLHVAAFTLIFNMGYIPEALNRVGFVAVAIVLATACVIFTRTQKLSDVEFDERDNHINKRVLAIDYGFVWVMLIAGCTASWFLMGLDGTVRVYMLCFLLYVSFLAAMLVHSGTTIIMYGGGTISKELMATEGEKNE